jgi:peptide deformylase
MAIRRILTVDNAADLATLKKISTPVETVTDDLRALMDDMLETMYDAPGIGLAAVQVGEPVRIIVMDLAREGEEPAPRYFVNPEILSTSEEVLGYEEGCLSVPEYFDEVERPSKVTLRYVNYRARPSSRKPRACSPSASSTRWTTWKASCSSTTCRACAATARSPR